MATERASGSVTTDAALKDAGLRDRDMISIFEIYKIGIGPSSSHTMAPMKAALAFSDELVSLGCFDSVAEVRVELFGSLALTGKGHATDAAILLGLSGEAPETVDVDRVPGLVEGIRRNREIKLAGVREIPFDENRHLLFELVDNPYDFSSTVRFSAFDSRGERLHSQAYFSLGGGAIARATTDGPADQDADGGECAVPYPFGTADELLAIGWQTGLSIPEIVLANEVARHDEGEVMAKLRLIWKTMVESIEQGLRGRGPIPGPLKLERRAPGLCEAIKSDPALSNSDPLTALDWINAFAIAVNEESASGGRVVTAPTNGSAGIIPAIGRYYERFVPHSTEDGVLRFLMAAAAIGIIYKKNASFAASEVGCQGEVGVACSMAAGGFVAAMGGTNEQIEMAAEIGMEHNLGLTCDPIGGYVQIPCIERNALGAVKAMDAARLALRSSGRHTVSLDSVIKTMWETGKDMQSKYKDTGKGGLAVNVVVC